MFDGYFNAELECLFGLTANMVAVSRLYRSDKPRRMPDQQCCGKADQKVLKAVGYRGALDIGYKYDDRTGQYKAIDVNPRTGVTFRLLVDTVGMDVVRALYCDMTGQPVLTGEEREGRKWMVEYFDIFTSPTYMRKDKLSVLQWLRSYKGLEELSWFAWDDLAPFFMMGWRSLQRVMGDKLKKSSDNSVLQRQNEAPLNLIPSNPPTVEV